MSDTSQELLGLVSRVAGKCLLVSQAHVKLLAAKEVDENGDIDALWPECLAAHKNDIEWIETGKSKVSVGMEAVQSLGTLSERGLKQLGQLIHRMDGMIGIATDPRGTFAKYYVDLQATVNAYVTVYQETKAMPEFDKSDEG